MEMAYDRESLVRYLHWEDSTSSVLSLYMYIWSFYWPKQHPELKIDQNIILFQVSSKKIHVVYTAPIVFCSVLFNIPRFFELRTEMKLTNVTIISRDNSSDLIEERMIPNVVMTEIRKNPSYSRDYVMIANSVSLIVIPMLVLIILNSLIFRKISKANARHNAISSHQRRDHSVAQMLIIIVLVRT